MLNKSFVGSWGLEHTGNIPHEIINIFRSDNGNIYLYVPPYGGFATSNHNVSYILLIGERKNNSVEVLYLAKGLELMHHGGVKATESEREELRNIILKDNIKYGGKYLNEINMAEFEEPSIFYMTFKVDRLLKPNKKMILSWKGTEVHDEYKDIYLLNSKYEFRQIAYIKDNDYDLMLSIVEDCNLWDENTLIEKVVLKQNLETCEINKKNFLKFIHKEYDENIFTNIFYELFKKTPDILNKFITEILNVDINEETFKVLSEVKTQTGNGRMDLLLVSNKKVIVIENKIKSGLNGIDKHNKLSQLTTYIDSIESIYKNLEHYYFIFEPNFNDIDIQKFDNKRGMEFKKIQYNRIYDFFNKYREEFYDSFYGIYIDDIIDALSKLKLTMKDIVLERFIKALS